MKLKLAAPIAGLLVALCAAACSKKTETAATNPPATTASGAAAQPGQDSSQALAPAGAPTTAPANGAAQPAPQSAPSGQQPGATTAPAETAQAAPQAPAPPPPPPQPETFQIPAGTPIAVRTVSSLSTKTNKAGEPFSATLASALVVNGMTIARQGSTVNGTIVNSDPGGKVKGVATITLGITRIRTADGQSLAVSAAPVEIAAKSTKGKDAAKIGVGAGAGALIGGIAGGGKGAGIGALVGGGAGTGVVLATRGDPAVVPSETVLNMKLSAPLTVTEKTAGSIDKNNAPPPNQE
ncbi:MAG: hypothetical protein WBW33_32540 [Bryobacteraceae bacterium]